VISAIRTSPKFHNSLTIWVFVLLFAGQGFRNLLSLTGYGILVSLTVVAVVICFKDSFTVRKVPPLLIAFTGLATLSTIWSAYRIETLIASIILIATSAIALLIAMHYTWKHTVKLLNMGLLISVIGSFVFELIVALIIKHPILPPFREFVSFTNIPKDSGVLNWDENLLFHGGPIQGFMGNRNLLGFVALLLIVTSLLLLIDKQINTWLGLSGIVFGLSAHFLTRSATIGLALAAVVVVLGGVYLIRKTPEKRKRLTSWIFVSFCVVAGIAALKNTDHLFSAFDRDPNLTHRTDIWHQVITVALQRPEGWGWVSYWPVWRAPFKDLITLGGVPVSQAHNAFLDTWLQLGLLGVGLLIAMALLVLSSSWRLVEHSRKGESVLPSGLFLLAGCLFFQALTESRLLLEGNWALLVILLVYTPHIFRKTRLQPIVEV
jgi:exopolysaccharide production protein ExoQ